VILRHSAFLHDVLTEGAQGQVLAVYRHSLYVALRARSTEQVAAVVDAPLGNGPLSLVARHLLDPPVAAGDPVVLEDGCLGIGPVSLSVAGSKPWDPVIRIHSTDLVPEAVEGCRDLVVREAPPHSLAALLPALRGDGADLEPWQRTALRHARQLVQGASTGSLGEVREGAMGLVGLGPGLTPSGDDFLCGFLLGLSVAGERRFIGVILDAAKATHRISRAYVWAAARGGAAEVWHRLLFALCTARGWEEATRAVLRTGETSGADALAGFLAWWATPARRPRTGRRPLPRP
jgi:hypothetical protein